MKIQEKNNKDILILVICQAIVVGLIYIGMKKIFCPVYGDILLYTDQAKSFADTGCLKFANNTSNSSMAILYPIMISIVYKFFYNAYTIIDTMRIVGAILITSAIYPAYNILTQLGVLGKKRLCLSAISIFIPDILQAWLPVSEVLAYPLFLWYLYVFLKDLEYESLILTLRLAVFSYILYLARSQFLMLPVAYILTISISFINNKNDYKIKKISLYGLTYTALYIFVPKILVFTKVLEKNDSLPAGLVSTAVSKFLDKPLYALLQWASGIVWYLFWTVLIFGIITVIIPFFYDGYSSKLKYFALFLKILLLTTIVLIVITIYNTEEPLEFDTHRVHFRYLMYFFVPYLYLLYAIDFQNFSINRKYILGGIVFALFIFEGNVVYSLRENFYLGVEAIPLSIFRVVKEYITLYPSINNLIVYLIYIVILLLVYLIIRMGIERFLMKMFVLVYLCFVIVTVSIYVGREYYCTMVAMGNYIQRYAPAAEYLNSYTKNDDVVICINNLVDDSEIESFRVVCRHSLDVMTIDEIIENYNSQNCEVDVRSFDRYGYFYLDETNHRILDKANYFMFRKGYYEDCFTVKNNIVYEDDYFVIYKLNLGKLDLILN